MNTMNHLPLVLEGNKKLYLNLKENFLNSTMSHSTIIYGEKGIGKSSFINLFVQYLFSNFPENFNDELNPKQTSLILNKTHPNYIIISKIYDDKLKKIKNYILIDQIRKLESFIYKSSLYNLPKIILIDSADDLNISSSNGLLKIIEEPQKNTFFFLVSHQLSLVLPTIRSRCIKFKFNKPNIKNFKKIILNKNNNLSKDEIELLYVLTNGSPGLSLNFISQNFIDLFNKTLNICNNKKILNNEIIELSTEVNFLNNDQFSSFLLIIKFILLNLSKIKLGIDIDINLIPKLQIIFIIYHIQLIIIIVSKHLII